jgi:DNA-binding NtrC family response regulator
MKRILFVDDDPLVLEGLQAWLHRLRTKWAMEFLRSGALALERMQERPCDVIVTDMRLPGMDGATLLEMISARWPHTIRIVLSGYAEQEQAVRLVPFAHQYLSRPGQPRQVEDVIDRCLLLHELLSHPGCARWSDAFARFRPCRPSIRSCRVSCAMRASRWPMSRNSSGPIPLSPPACCR